MTEPVDLDTLDFDAFYRSEPLVPGMEYTGVPWDIGEPQPAVVALERSGRIKGEVLDVGGGLGDNAIFLATQGHRVTGIDVASTAIDQARQRVPAPEVQVEFAVADATDLRWYEGRFDTVVDSALYHCLSEERRPLYVAALHRATTAGALLNLLCFSDGDLDGVPAPLPVSEDSLRSTLVTGGWAITDLRHGTLSARAQAMITPDGGPYRGNARTDNKGRILLPIWVVHAHRTVT